MEPCNIWGLALALALVCLARHLGLYWLKSTLYLVLYLVQYLALHLALIWLCIGLALPACSVSGSISGLHLVGSACFVSSSQLALPALAALALLGGNYSYGVLSKSLTGWTIDGNY